MPTTSQMFQLNIDIVLVCSTDTVTNDTGTVTSPKIDGQDKYPSNLDCSLSITTTSDKVILQNIGKVPYVLVQLHHLTFPCPSHIKLKPILFLWCNNETIVGEVLFDSPRVAGLLPVSPCKASERLYSWNRSFLSRLFRWIWSGWESATRTGWLCMMARSW